MKKENNSIYKNIIEPQKEVKKQKETEEIKQGVDIEEFNNKIEETLFLLKNNKEKYRLLEYLTIAVFAYEKETEVIFGKRIFDKKDRSSIMGIMGICVDYLNPYRFPFIMGIERDKKFLEQLKSWRDEHYPVIG